MNFMGWGGDGVKADGAGVGMGLMSTTVSLFTVYPPTLTPRSVC